MVYFSFYHNVKGLVPEAKVGTKRIDNFVMSGIQYIIVNFWLFEADMKVPHTVFQDPKAEFARRFVIGFAAGTLASMVNIPFDVAKSRIQGPQPVPGEIKYKKCFATIATVYREEG